MKRVSNHNLPLKARCSLIALSLAAISCSAPQKGLFAPVSLRATLCETLSKQRANEVAKERYLPNDLVLRRWPAVHKVTEVTEAEFADRLLSDGPRGTLLIARGGTGKSKLAWSLEAQLCGRAPVVRVDLRWDVQLSADSKPGDPILSAALKALGGKSKVPEAALRRSLNGRRWVMLLDSLDEVALVQRKELVGHVNAAQERFKNLHVVVFTRPPVFSGTYGLKHAQGLVELPQLSCKRSEQLRAKMLRPMDVQQAFDSFLKRYGLGHRAKTDSGRCYYPHVATYRDFFVLKMLANSEADLPTFGSRAKVYERYMSVILTKDMKGFSITAQEVLSTLDAMIRQQAPDAGARNVEFEASACERHLPAHLTTDRKSICERMMQSNLLRKMGSKFRLRNQTLSDLFMARYSASVVASEGCKGLQSRASIFESNEVAGFLVGLPAGQKCLGQVVNALCQYGGFAQHNFEQLDQGLPGGRARFEIIQRAQLAADEGASMCRSTTLDRLDKAARRVLTKAPENAPAPQAPGQ